jgi:hypothetical protein
MRVLKLYPADHFGNLEQMPKAGGPVRDGQTGVIAGDQPARNDQQESQSGHKNSKAMMSGVIRGRGQNCSLRVLIILASSFDSLAKMQTFETQRNVVSGGIEFAKIAGIAKIANRTANC